MWPCIHSCSYLPPLPNLPHRCSPKSWTPGSPEYVMQAPCLHFSALPSSSSSLPFWTHEMGFPDGSVVKNLPATQETQKTSVWSLDQEDPLKKEWKPISVFWPGKCHGQRGLVSYSPKGHKELDTPEQLSIALHIMQINPENPLYSTGNSTVVTYMGKKSKKRGCVYTYRWFTLLYSRN